MVVETEWMAAAETRMPTATKALAEREASMDGNVVNEQYARGGAGLKSAATTISCLREHGFGPMAAVELPALRP